MTGPEPDSAALLRGATFLVVDDHLANVQLLEKILRRAGVAHVHSTSDPAGVVELYRRVAPDIVLLDLHMPGMDGVAVLQALAAATPPHEFVPVVVLTADATPQARERVLTAGASDFLTKPFDHTEVLLRTQNLLHRRALTVQLAAHNAELRAEVEERRAVEERQRRLASERRLEIEAVIAAGGPRMVFQPIADLATRTVVGYEALARFDLEPPRPPDVWFRDAVEVGLGRELELAALRGTLGAFTAAAGHGLLALNLSPATVVAPELPPLLLGAATSVVVEITEHVRVGDYDALVSTITDLREAGVRFAVDDAGAGFASLHHILRLSPDIIKLDISLTRGIHADPVKRALATSLVAFSGEIEATLLAEGIETEAELVCLADLGVPLGQGYHLARPGELPGSPASDRSQPSPR